MNTETTLRTNPGFILEKLRSVNRQIAAVVMKDIHTTADKRKVEALRKESDRLTHEYTDARNWQLKRVLK